MAVINSNSNRDMKECPSCHEMKPKPRFFTQDDDSICRRCQIGLFHEQMQTGLQEAVADRPWQSILSHGYVYLFYSELMGLHKIGKSINPNERRFGLSIPNVEIIFAFCTQHMSVHETLLHRIYKPQRVGGEWFKLDDTHIAEIKYIGSRLGIVVESPEDFDWDGVVQEQINVEKAQRAELLRIKKAEEAARIKAYRAYRAQFRRRCPNCLRLFRIKGDSDHKFCSKDCNAQFKNSKRIQNTYLSDPDNIAIAMIDTYQQVLMHDYDETEIGAQTYRAATERMRELEHIEEELNELANQARYLMSKD